MWLTHRGRNCYELDPQVFRALMSFYPEENLLQRKIPANALKTGAITKSDLQHESEVLFLPWQMFLLNLENLRRHLSNIERNREDKIRIGEFTARAARRGPVPCRLIDRYIRAQNFLVSSAPYLDNPFNGSLRGRPTTEAANSIIAHFNINLEEVWGLSKKQAALEYLVGHVEGRQINVAIGTLDPRLVPTTDNHKDLYKNISGFCLKDSKVPFLFVNTNMSDEEEPAGRQIYTLVYLLALIGLNIYTLTRDLRAGRTPRVAGAEYLRTAHDITSETLMPARSLEYLRGEVINSEIVDALSYKHKLTPSAVLFRLWREKLITKEEQEALAPEEFKVQNGGRTPRIEKSIKKLNGTLVYDRVNTNLAQGQITQNQAQYILMGRIRPKTWGEYLTHLGL